MSTQASHKPRPYWHVDAKWITGILLLLVLSVTFLIFILVQLTAPQTGIDVLATTLASSFSAQAGGMDANGDIAIMKQKIADSPTGEWQPIPGLDIFVREQDIAGKTPREVRLWFFRQWAEPLYYEGVTGLEKLISDPEMKQGLEGGVGPLGIISAATHRKLLVVFGISGLVSLVFLALLVLFSYRFGRLGSPGCVTFLTAIPGLLLMGAAKGWLGNATGATAGEANPLSQYTQLARDVLPQVVQKAFSVYLLLVLLGLGLMLVALVLSIFFRERKDKEKTE